ncbi:immunoglobulin G-binding protein A-like [Venturia nashicola]|uniref:Immunoglobulin G-binding protein A-like n=1 Tax=Venturia nashicola TaxID=86259 RepID=A0A4Z1PFY1_9PEZI|nr:immunoglobulin G-binding protein A-like [Venturia nashicola]
MGLLDFLHVCAVLVHANAICNHRSLIWFSSSTDFGPVFVVLTVFILLIVFESAAALLLVSLFQTLYSLLPPISADIEPKDDLDDVSDNESDDEFDYDPDNEPDNTPHQDRHDDSIGVPGILSVCADLAQSYAVIAFICSLQSPNKCYESLDSCYDFLDSKVNFLVINPLTALAVLSPGILLVIIAAAVLVYGCFEVLCYFCVTLPASALKAILVRVLRTCFARVPPPAVNAYFARVLPRFSAGPTTRHDNAPDDDSTTGRSPINHGLARTPVNGISDAMVLHEVPSELVQLPKGNGPASVPAKGDGLVSPPVNTVSKTMVVYDAPPQFFQLPKGGGPSHVYVNGQIPIHNTVDIGPFLPRPQHRVAANTQSSIRIVSETKLISSPPEHRFPANTRSCIKTVAETEPFHPHTQAPPPIKMSIISRTVAETEPVPYQIPSLALLNQYEQVLFEGHTQAWQDAHVNSVIQALQAQAEANEAYEQGFANGGGQEFLSGLETGRQEGLAIGGAQGLVVGRDTGRQQGFLDGEAQGLLVGRKTGLEEAGLQQGFSNGEAQGLRAGRKAGLHQGFSEGEAAGIRIGLESGFKDGEATGFQNGIDQGFTRGYRYGETVFLSSSAAGESFGYDTELVEPKNLTTEVCIECVHGNQLPIGMRMPSAPTTHDVDGQAPREILVPFGTATSSQEAVHAVVDHKALGTNVSEPDQNQRQADSEIALSAPLPPSAPPSPQNSGFLSGPSSSQPFFGPGAVANICNDFIPGLGFPATEKPQIYSASPDATSPLVSGIRSKCSAGSTPLIPQSESAPTLPSSHTTLPSNIPIPQQSRFQLGDASMTVSKDSVKVFRPALARIKRYELAGSCPLPAVISSIPALATNDPSKVFEFEAPTFRKAHTEKNSALLVSSPTSLLEKSSNASFFSSQSFQEPQSPWAFASSSATQASSSCPIDDTTKAVIFKFTASDLSSSSASSCATATVSPAAPSVTSSPTAAPTTTTAQPSSSATSKAALKNAKDSSLLNPSTKRGGKRGKAPRSNTSR